LKPYKLYDTGGLYLIISPKGGRWWRFKYRAGGKERGMSCGTYPKVSLAQARDKRDKARSQVANDIDPAVERKASKQRLQGDSFEVVSREWFGKFGKDWVQEHADVVRSALRFSALTFQRPGEIRKAEWGEIDLDGAMWRLPSEKMKLRREHLVPLSRQVVEILREIQPLTGSGRYVFPGNRSVDRPMSENTIVAALRYLGFEQGKMTAHGFRSMASTLLHEMGWNSDVIERQLAHVEQNSIKGARTTARSICRNGRR
jgi:integrase